MNNIQSEIQKEFFKMIDLKNSWGKKEIKSMYLEASVKVLSNAITSDNTFKK